ncbi:MAG: hypothetical protein DCF25_21425 [Leptolyngbya foveolarum]|uniref:SH3b domain-containing protein n=1 Tax=Leptolyngbya foveolarum TaxID=47253 RepID=A0A2W4TQ15_9CYAN|nr:MAG: hypothetical protein DCF25_21425 [Leptolyngbya foveolarum]
MTTGTRTRTGTLKSNNSSITSVNIRHAADGNWKTDLPQGTQVRVIQASAAPDSGGHTWYKISYGTANELGWVRDDVIVIKDEPAGGGKELEVATEENTRLFFETPKRSFRVFQGSERLHLNIYDKSTRKTQQIGAICLPSAISAPEGADVPWQSYVAEQNGRVYVARFVPLKQIELVVSDADNWRIISKASGYGGRGSAYT